MNRELLENVFVTALEGGSNYWYYINARNHAAVRRAVPVDVDRYFATAMLSAILDHGVQVEVNDIENEDDILGTLSAEGIRQRLELLAADDSYSWALDAETDDEGDAESSDVIFQYLVIGEVWYS
jgi:hypothetical protein